MFLEHDFVGAEMVVKAVGAVPVPIELERGENCSGWTGELGCKGDDVINGATLLFDEAACWSTGRRVIYSSSRVTRQRDSDEADGMCFDIEMTELSASTIVESSAGAMAAGRFIKLIPMF